MRIEIGLPQLVHKALDKGYKVGERQDGDESWKERCGDAEDLDELKRVSGIRYPTIELTYPLKSAGFTARRNPFAYSALIYLVSRDPSAFRNKSGNFERELKEAGEGQRFYITSPHLTGHILDAQGNPIASIMEEKEGEIREIAIGNNGAQLRKFPIGLNDLKRDLKELEKYVNLALKVIYADLESLGRMPKSDGLVLYINP